MRSIVSTQAESLGFHTTHIAARHIMGRPIERVLYGYFTLVLLKIPKHGYRKSHEYISNDKSYHAKQTPHFLKANNFRICQLLCKCKFVKTDHYTSVRSAIHHLPMMNEKEGN